MALISQSNKQAFRNPWVIGWVAMVVLVFSVNVFFITSAFRNKSGLVSKHYYDAGQNIEQTIHTREAARSALGWNVTFDTGEVHMAQPAPFTVDAKDKAGKPLTGARVVVRAYRPSDSDADFLVPLAEKAPGKYTGNVTFKLKGVWDVVVDVTHGENSSEVTKRVIAFAN